jgi:hypothetical protein
MQNSDEMDDYVSQMLDKLNEHKGLTPLDVENQIPPAHSIQQVCEPSQP